jgi:hypothetical protein
MPTTTTTNEPTVYTHDIFISYSRANKDWVRKDLLPRLKEAKLSVFIDEEDIEFGANLMDSIGQAVEKSRHTLAVLTPFWLNGEWTTHERNLVLLADPSGKSRRLIPLLLEECELPKNIAHLNYVDFRDVTKRQAALDKLLRELGRTQKDINQAVTDSAQKGLRALIDLMRSPAVHDAVGDFEENREQACQQIRILKRYKDLHDHFHNTERSYDLVIKEKKSLQEETGSWDDLQMAALDLEAEITPLLDYARSAGFADSEILWSARLERAQHDLLAAIEKEDAKLLNNATQRLAQVVGQVPTDLNGRLFKAADDLPLAKLVEKLKIVGTGLKNLGLSGEAAARLVEFDQGLDALERLTRSLKAFVTNHNCLQEIDNQLRPIDLSSQSDLEEIQGAWQDLQHSMGNLSDDSGAEWITQFRATSARLNDALSHLDVAVADPAAAKSVKRDFIRYRGLVTQGFRQVDRELKTFCEQLQDVGEALGKGLRRMQDA